MSTVIRPEISKQNKYYISRHRYYELKHFCLQYPEFKKIYNNLCGKIPGGIIQISNDDVVRVDQSAEVRQRYLNKITMIENTAKMLDPVLGEYILKGVTEGLPYTYFRMREDIPCCKDVYYDLYRKFFWLLNFKKKDDI